MNDCKDCIHCNDGKHACVVCQQKPIDFSIYFVTGRSLSHKEDINA